MFSWLLSGIKTRFIHWFLDPMYNTSEAKLKSVLGGDGAVAKIELRSLSKAQRKAVNIRIIYYCLFAFVIIIIISLFF